MELLTVDSRDGVRVEVWLDREALNRNLRDLGRRAIGKARAGHASATSKVAAGALVFLAHQSAGLPK
jgi:hypothetical protein